MHTTEYCNHAGPCEPDSPFGSIIYTDLTVWQRNPEGILLSDPDRRFQIVFRMPGETVCGMDCRVNGGTAYIERVHENRTDSLGLLIGMLSDAVRDLYHEELFGIDVSDDISYLLRGKPPENWLDAISQLRALCGTAVKS